ncbi:MAG: hypothetical protein Ta2D_05750 [Rickettsiales bacterium]|nr:MAG: hypothetical protein Ta2D_05750 [Rickettsiales bacterium]
MTDKNNNSSNNIDKNNADILKQKEEYKNLKAQITDFFKNNLQGKSINKEGLGNIRMTAKTRKEFLKYIDNNKFEVIKNIIDIIEKSKIDNYADIEHPRKDDITGFYYLQADITSIINDDKKQHQVEVIVAVNKDGYLLYDLFIDSTHKERQKNKKVFENPQDIKPVTNSNTSSNHIITNNN